MRINPAPALAAWIAAMLTPVLPPGFGQWMWSCLQPLAMRVGG
jgi:hypothetical protein